METPIIVALIGIVGSVIVAVLNQFLAHRVKVQENKTDKLYALSMSDDLFGHLKKLSPGPYGPYWIDDERKFGLAAELNYLKMLGYIKFDQDPKVPDLRELPTGDQPELSHYVSITQQGRDFITLREEALRSA